jgi:hypothetical protein
MSHATDTGDRSTCRFLQNVVDHLAKAIDVAVFDSAATAILLKLAKDHGLFATLPQVPHHLAARVLKTS